MYYKIQKSLGRITAVQMDNLDKSGVCVEYRNYEKRYLGHGDPSIRIYTNGKLEDICLNGYTFPCVYNDIKGDGIWFDYIDREGNIQKVYPTLRGGGEPQTVEYFYTLLYNISCCNSREQFQNLYHYVINEYWKEDRENALAILNFIEGFTPQLANVENTEYLQGLKQQLNTRFKEAQAVISTATCPK